MSVETKDRVLVLPKASAVVAEALFEGLAFDAYKALRDGFQPGVDISVLLSSVVSNFAAAVGQVPNLQEALRQDALGSGEALVVSALETARKIRALPALP